MTDERITWVRERPSRKLVQIIEPIPTGFSVTTQWIENGEIARQDCEISIREAPPMDGGAGKLS